MLESKQFEMVWTLRFEQSEITWTLIIEQFEFVQTLRFTQSQNGSKSFGHSDFKRSRETRWVYSMLQDE